MMTARKRLVIKRLAAATLAVLLSVSVFGAYGQDSVVKLQTAIGGSADEEDPAAEYERQMQELDKKKQELDAKIAAAGSDIKGQQEKLDAVNEKAETIKTKIEKISKKAAQLEDEMAELDGEMRDTQYNLQQSEEQIGTDIDEFKDRLRAMYVAGNESYSQVLVNADSFYDVLMRVELVKRVAEHDNDTIDSLLDQKAQIEDYQAQLTEQSEALKEKSAEYGKKQKLLADQQAELLRLKNEYGNSIAALNGDLSGYIAQAGNVSSEYAIIAEKARTATTTTTTMTTEAPKTTSSDSDETTKKKAKTTKKSSSPEDEEETTEATTTTQAPQTEAPRTTTEQPEVTTQAPTTTAKPKTTTAKPKTTTAQTTTQPEDDMDVEYEDDDRQAKVDIVVSYAKGMVGGSYVWAGEQYGATDCSGLVMLSYRQVGINLPHLASSQANYGTSVSYNDLQPGDLVFFGGSSYSSIYHVAMYIGDGKIVHAESTATGIVISYLSNVAKYNNITCMKRLL